MPVDQIDIQSLTDVFKSAAATYKNGFNVIPDSGIKLVIKPVVSTTKPMIKFIFKF